MTREEFIRIAKKIIFNMDFIGNMPLFDSTDIDEYEIGDGVSSMELNEFLDEFYTLLFKTLEQEPKEIYDMATNKALAETIRNYLESGVDLLLTDDDYRTIIKVLEQEPKAGKWINYNWSDTNGTCRWGIKCSQCNKEYKYGAEVWLSPNYCPNCGAKMEVEE